jgi:photosystem II stability/assembly factor-like uncharacterized protein
MDVPKSEHRESRTGGPRRRRIVLLLGPALLIAGTVLATLQAPGPAAADSQPWTSLAWWRDPIESEPLVRVPIFPGALNAIVAPTGTSDIWAVGDGGLVLHSPDGGRTWSSQNLSARYMQARPPSARTTASLTRRSTARLRPASYAPPPSTAQYQPNQSQQQATVAVPNVIGLDVKNADGILQKVGLKLGSTVTRSSAQPRNTVISQNPNPGVRMPPGSRIDLAVSTGPQAPTPVDTSRGRARLDSIPQSAGVPTVVDTTAFYPRLTSICFADANRGWVVGGQGALFFTSNAGVTWRQLATPTRSTFTSIACRPLSRPIAVSEAGGPVLRAEQDTVWRAVSYLRMDAPHPLVASDTSTLWVAGPASRDENSIDVLMHSGNGGGTWDFVSLPNAARARAVAFASPSTGFVATIGGDLLETRDGGRTWSSFGLVCQGTIEGRDKPARDLFVLENRIGVVITDSLQRVTTWAPPANMQACGSRANLGWPPGVHASVALARDGSLLVAGIGVLRIDEQSSTTALIARERFRSLAFADSVTGWAGTSDGKVAATKDGGHSWTPRRVTREYSGPIDQIVARSAKHLFAVIGRTVHESQDGGETWAPYTRSNAPPSFRPVAFHDDRVGWGTTDSLLLRTADGGATWSAVPGSGPVLRDSVTRSFAFLFDTVANQTIATAAAWKVTIDGRLSRVSDDYETPVANSRFLTAAVPLKGGALVMGLDSLGFLVRSIDGGSTWADVPLSSSKYPAPWYYPFLVLCAAITLVTAKRVNTNEDKHEESVSDILVSDRPLREGDRDVLDFGKIAGGLSRFLRNPRTEPPITVAITGPWGSGKSSLMHMLRRDLTRSRFRTVWFNAWHHQREEALLASLLESVRASATPEPWTAKGLRFHAKLLVARYRRYAVPVTILLPIFALALGYVVRDPGQRLTDLGNLYKNLLDVLTHQDSKGEIAHVAPSTSILAVLVSVVGVIATYLKGIRAFGVNPSVIAKSVANAAKPRTLEAQTSFRYRFARDFREVTDALQPERLVIFIDDLDRCRPEQVLEILEAVNFLVESGDCVVVLGIDRDRVTGCVAIGFKEVASMLVSAEEAEADATRQTASSRVPAPPRLQLARAGEKPEEGGSAASLGGNGKPAERQKSEREYQLDYARHYLEKLINMEIPIPPANPERIGSVLTRTTEADATAQPVEPTIIDRLRDARRPIQYTLVAGLVIGAFLLGRVDWNARQEIAAATPSATLSQSTTQTGAARLRTPTDSPTVAQPTVGDVSIRRTPIAFTPGATSAVVWWEGALVVVLALGVLVWLLTPQEATLIDDSPAFSRALKVWSPVLFQRLKTPRAAKKFLNRLRFFAMSQRAQPVARAPIQQLLTFMSGVPVIGRVFRMFGAGDDASDALVVGAIPEDILVALSVVSERCPDWFNDDRFWELDLPSYAEERGDDVPADVVETIAEFAVPPRFAAYRSIWSTVSAGVRTS